jgi:hypothetical protein
MLACTLLIRQVMGTYALTLSPAWGGYAVLPQTLLNSAPPLHSLKALDVEALKALASRVNIIPVIAKADTMTPRALTTFKEKVGFVPQPSNHKQACAC